MRSSAKALVFAEYRDRVLDLALDGRLEMILIILADPRQVGDHIDPVLTQMRRRPDAGQLQDLWRGKRPCGEDHLAPRLDDRAIAEQNAGRGLSFKYHLVNPGRRLDRQVAAAFRLAQERFGGAATAAAAGRGLVEADALLPSPVEVFVVGNADLLRGADEGPRQRMTIGTVRNRQLALTPWYSPLSR